MLLKTFTIFLPLLYAERVILDQNEELLLHKLTYMQLSRFLSVIMVLRGSLSAGALTPKKMLREMPSYPLSVSSSFFRVIGSHRLKVFVFSLVEEISGLSLNLGHGTRGPVLEMAF